MKFVMQAKSIKNQLWLWQMKMFLLLSVCNTVWSCSGQNEQLKRCSMFTDFSCCRNLLAFFKLILLLLFVDNFCLFELLDVFIFVFVPSVCFAQLVHSTPLFSESKWTVHRSTASRHESRILVRGAQQFWPQGALSPKIAQNRVSPDNWNLHDFEKILGARGPGFQGPLDPLVDRHVCHMITWSDWSAVALAWNYDLVNKWPYGMKFAGTETKTLSVSF